MQKQPRSAKIQYDPPQGQGGTRLPETRGVGVGEGRHRPPGAKPLEWQEGNNLEVDGALQPQRGAKVPPSRRRRPCSRGGRSAAKSHNPNEVFSLRENEMFCKMKQNKN